MNQLIMRLLVGQPWLHRVCQTQYLNLQISSVFFWQLAASRLVGKVFSLVLLMIMFGLDMHIKVILVLAHLSALKTGEILFLFIGFCINLFSFFINNILPSFF